MMGVRFFRTFADILFTPKINNKTKSLIEKVKVYNALLHQYGLKDYQVHIGEVGVVKLDLMIELTGWLQVAEGFEKVSKRLFLRMLLKRALTLVTGDVNMKRKNATRSFVLVPRVLWCC